jgi:hypothetical protein
MPSSSTRAAPQHASVRAVSRPAALRRNRLLVAVPVLHPARPRPFCPRILWPRRRASARRTRRQPKADASALAATTLMPVPPRHPLRLGGSPRLHRSKPALAAPPMCAVLLCTCRAPPGQCERRQLPHCPLPQLGALCPRWQPKAGASPLAAPTLTLVPPRRPLRLGGSPRLCQSNPAKDATPTHAVLLRACRYPPDQRTRRQPPSAAVSRLAVSRQPCWCCAPRPGRAARDRLPCGRAAPLCTPGQPLAGASPLAAPTDAPQAPAPAFATHAAPLQDNLVTDSHLAAICHGPLLAPSRCGAPRPRPRRARSLTAPPCHLSPHLPIRRQPCDRAACGTALPSPAQRFPRLHQSEPPKGSATHTDTHTGIRNACRSMPVQTCTPSHQPHRCHQAAEASLSLPSSAAQSIRLFAARGSQPDAKSAPVEAGARCSTLPPLASTTRDTRLQANMHTAHGAMLPSTTARCSCSAADVPRGPRARHSC